jgi:hypothetical protein
MAWFPYNFNCDQAQALNNIDQGGAEFPDLIVIG